MSKKAKKVIKTEWDLTPFYKSPEDKQIENDIKDAEKVIDAFVHKYQNVDLNNSSILKQSLEDYFAIKECRLSDAYLYLNKLIDLDSRKEYLQAKANLLLQKIQNISNKVIFYEVKLSKIPLDLQKKFLDDSSLNSYKYYLEVIFKNSRYVLSEKEEKILNLKYLTSHKLWTDFTENLYSKAEVKHKGKNIPVSKALKLISSIKTQKERYELYSKVVHVNESLSQIAEKELNAIILDKKINDELRGFVEPVDATLIGNEDDKNTVFTLRDVLTSNYNLVHRFYKVKKKMLGLKKLLYSDRFANVGKFNKKIKFDEALSIFDNVLGNIDPVFQNILKQYASSGQFDVFPKTGKRGGAYCSSSYNNPTYILLNHVDDIDSVYTLAHEMGHAFHSEFSKSQPVYYQGYTTSTAEVASTLFETFMFNELYSKMSEKEKVIALHDKISDSISTIFTQIMLFNFEIELHEQIRQKGSLSNVEIAELMMKHIKALYGSEFKYESKIGYSYVGWSHIRYFFYTYTYSMGLLISKSLYHKYSEDKSYIEQIKKFMSAGGSMSPYDIFKNIGIDISKKDFWMSGIKSIEKDIIELEKLVNKKK
jgi:oligoendopeptidase F